MGFNVWQPYLDEKTYQKKQFGKFNVQCFDLPHNGTPNRGFLIKVDGQKILYMTDFEYCPFRFNAQKINHILIEYIKNEKPNADCGAYIDEDISWFGEMLAKEVKK